MALAIDTTTAICGETHAVTAGAGSSDIGTCWLRLGHGGDHDYQVEPPAARHAERLVDDLLVPHRSEEIVAWLPVTSDPEAPASDPYCPTCNYLYAVHGGDDQAICPTEDQAVEAWGRPS